MSTCVPRRSWHSSITAPTCSFGVRIVARMYGSSIEAISTRSGMSDGECTTTSLPSVSRTSYSTFGVVEGQLLERVAQLRELVGLHGEEAAEDHRLDLAVAGERVGRGAGLRGER